MKAKSKKKQTPNHIPTGLGVLLLSIVGVLALTVMRPIIINQSESQVSAARPRSATPTPPPPTPAVPQYNVELLKNNSFELDQDNNGIPDNWVSHFAPPDQHILRDCTVSFTGSCSFKLLGGYDIVKQYVPFQGKTGDKITISGWSKAQQVQFNSRKDQSITYWVQAWINYADGTTEVLNVAKFTMGTHGFEKASNMIVAQKPYVGLTYFVRFSMKGEVWFDDVSLTIVPQNWY